MIARLANIPLTGLLLVCIATVLWFVGKGCGFILSGLAKAVFG
ncbi:hypothetical protein [Bosea sp. MMO-172]